MPQGTELDKNLRYFHNNMFLFLPDLRLESGSVDTSVIFFFRYREIKSLCPFSYDILSSRSFLFRGTGPYIESSVKSPFIRLKFYHKEEK